MNLRWFFLWNLTSHSIFDLRLPKEGNTEKFIILEWWQQIQWVVNYPCLSWLRLPMFIIGWSKLPRCFKGVEQLPCRYKNQNKSWMDNVLFEKLILEMNKEFPKEKKKVILIIDNCPAHPTIDNIKSTELIFLPPNTTSKLQPMDQRVICSLIAYYKALALQRLVVAINKGRDLPGFFILDAMKMLDLVWSKKKTSTIINCIEKARISKDEQKSAQSDDHDPFKDLQNQIKRFGDFSCRYNSWRCHFCRQKHGEYSTFTNKERVMPFSLSGEDIQQKCNTLSISIDRNVTAEMTQGDIRTFFQWDIQYILFNFQNRKGKKTFNNSKGKKTFNNSNYFHLSLIFTFLVPCRFELLGVYCIC